MDYALANYLTLSKSEPRETVKNKQIDINKIVINEFIATLDTTETTKETYLKGVRKFIKWCSDNDIREVSKINLIQYKEYLKENYKASTISMYITSVKKLFKFLEGKGIKNIASDLKGAKNSKSFKKDTLTIDQARELLKSIDRTTNEGKRNYALTLLLLTTGLRTIEIERANIEDIRTIGTQAVLYIQGKGHDDKDDYVKLTSDTLKAINEYLLIRENKAPKQPLFISFSDRSKGGRLKTRSIRDIEKKAFKNIGIDSDKITTHSLRHTAITLSLLGGATIQEAQQLARHTNINTTLIYAHNIERIDNKAEDSIQKLLNGKD